MEKMGNLAFNQKLNYIKEPPKKWNTDVFGNIDKKIEALENEVK